MLLAWQTERLLAIEIARDAYTVCVEPRIVVEVAFGDIQVSQRHPGGRALRFARVKRYRTDKAANAAGTFDAVRKLAATAAS
jgi:DNA ligase 1